MFQPLNDLLPHQWRNSLGVATSSAEDGGFESL